MKKYHKLRWKKCTCIVGAYFSVVTPSPIKQYNVYSGTMERHRYDKLIIIDGM